MVMVVVMMIVIIMMCIIYFAFTPKLNDRMPDLKFFTQDAVNFLGKLGSFTDEHILRIYVAAHGIHARSYCPDMDIMRIINPWNLFETLNNSINIDFLWRRLQQHIHGFHHQFIRPDEDKHTYHDADDRIDNKPVGIINDACPDYDTYGGKGVAQHMEKCRPDVQAVSVSMVIPFQDAGTCYVSNQTHHGYNEHLAAGDGFGVHKALISLVKYPHRNHKKGYAIKQGCQYFQAVEAIRLFFSRRL